MRHVLATMFAVAIATAAALPANAFDLTGHWEGKWSCTVFDSGAKDKDGNSESTFDVTSLGNNTFGARIDGSLNYRGIEIPNGTKPEKGELAIAHCGGDDDLTTQPFAELGRWKVSTKGEKGTITGITIWSNGASHIATCKYKYKRSNTTNPNLTYTCP